MKNELGKEMTEKDKLKDAVEMMAEVCCVLFECEDEQGVAAAYMADALIKYLQVIYRGDDVLLAACDYAKYEGKMFQWKLNTR